MHTALPYLLMFLSGFASLGYEMVWVRALAAGLGHEMISVLAVIAAFFVGTAIGAWLLEAPLGTRRDPRRGYALLELAIGAWAVVLVHLIPRVADLGARLMGVSPPPALQWGVTFLLPLILLLPATLAMGATLPAMVAVGARIGRSDRNIGGWYGANTLGAVAGVLSTTFWIVPAMGFSQTQYILALVNLACALGVFGLGQRGAVRKPLVVPPQSIESAPAARLLTLLFLSGLLGIGYEVLTVRVLSQVLGSTVSSFAILLSIYLFGTAAGTLGYQLLLSRRRSTLTLGGLLVAQAFTCMAGMGSLSQSTVFYTALGRMGIHWAEAGVVLAAFLPPTLVMGALFSHLTQAAKLHSQRIGSALAANMLGSALAPFLFGVVLLPALGPAPGMALIATAYLLLLPDRRPVLVWPAAACALAAGLFLFLPHPLDQLRLSPGESVAAHQNGIMADVAVVRDARQHFHLMVNNHYQMGGTASRYSDQRQALIPLMLHPDPQRMLLLGLGTGTTAATVARYGGLKVDGVELLPEIVPLMFYFQSSIERIGTPENLNIFTADARRFVLSSPSAYDVIVADRFHPSRDGAGFLYTREHFQAIRERLSDDGIFCQWLSLYQMDMDLLRLITRTFLDVFPDGSAVLAHHSLTQPVIGLIAGRHPLQVDAQAFNTRLSNHPALARDLRAVGLANVYTLLGNYLADAGQLHTFAGAGPLNTDDHPAVLFKAPRSTYRTAADGSASDRLLTLVQAFSPHPADILTASATQTQQMRLAAYWQARNAYLATGAHIAPISDVDSLIARVATPLMAIVRTSPDFEAAYRPLLTMAARLNPKNPQMASRLLTDLENAAPARPEAGEMRLALFRGE